jgi:pyruvate dehydrogenase E1 component
VPRRVVRSQPLPLLSENIDKEFDGGSPTAVSTTMVFTRLLRNLIRDPEIGKRIVPIIPDEARTFGMDPLFKEVGIYAAGGQRYEPVDSDLVLSYREAKDGQVLEEGINEAGSMASLQAAGTSYATHGEPMVPFYIFYSMFGFQRTGDQAWAFGDQRGRGFMIGATAGRTTLAGEGLQHDDGHTHILASTVPVVRAYDPAYAYELATIVRDGIKTMYTDGQDVFYYVTVYNENYPQAAKPADADEGIIRGIYRLAEAPEVKDPKGRVRLVGSGSILQQVLAARDLLAERGIAAEVYSATSFQQLRNEALSAERWNLLNPDKEPRIPYVQQVLGPEGGPIIVATDWIKALPDMVTRWISSPYLVLGTDGFGRSDTRENLRAWFGIDAPHIAATAYTGLVQCGELDAKAAAAAIAELGVDPEATDPLTA